MGCCPGCFLQCLQLLTVSWSHVHVSVRGSQVVDASMMHYILAQPCCVLLAMHVGFLLCTPKNT